MDIRERETLALLAALTDFQVEIPKMETIQPIITYPLEMNPLTDGNEGRNEKKCTAINHTRIDDVMKTKSSGSVHNPNR